MTKSRNLLPKRVFWTKAQIALLREHYPHKRTADLVAIVGRDIKSMWSKAKTLGLKKTFEYLSSEASGRLMKEGHRGVETRFKKGQVPFNKGKKGVNYPGMKATQFKKGERTGIAVELYKPIGTERISKDGYLQRKINDDFPPQKRWRAVHILIWEEVNGPLPKGHAIVFKDGNIKNIVLDNLECISRADLMRRNTYHQYPKEIALLIQLKGVLTRKINRREKDDRNATE